MLTICKLCLWWYWNKKHDLSSSHTGACAEEQRPKKRERKPVMPQRVTDAVKSLRGDGNEVPRRDTNGPPIDHLQTRLRWHSSVLCLKFSFWDFWRCHVLAFVFQRKSSLAKAFSEGCCKGKLKHLFREFERVKFLKGRERTEALVLLFTATNRSNLKLNGVKKLCSRFSASNLALNQVFTGVLCDTKQRYSIRRYPWIACPWGRTELPGAGIGA